MLKNNLKIAWRNLVKTKLMKCMAANKYIPEAQFRYNGDRQPPARGDA
jgi:hypothetical protein